LTIEVIGTTPTDRADDVRASAGGDLGGEGVTGAVVRDNFENEFDAIL
jgi:hypothetical protein